MNRRILLLLVSIFIPPLSIYGQVYNYVPLSFFDIETNPTTLTSRDADGRFKLIHKNSLSGPNPFSLSTARYSERLNNGIWGGGLSLTGTSLNQKYNYYHGGLGIGYRNVLFNAFYLKFGAMYKVIRIDSPSSSFDYFKHTPTETSNATFSENINIAVSITGETDRFYFSLSTLNHKVPWAEEVVDLFPTYLQFNLGNLYGLWSKHIHQEISYSGLVKYVQSSDRELISHYLNLKFYIPLTRKTNFYYGGQIGMFEEEYLHLIPSLAIGSAKWVVNLNYNTQIRQQEKDMMSYPTFQISITTLL